MTDGRRLIVAACLLSAPAALAANEAATRGGPPRRALAGGDPRFAPGLFFGLGVLALERTESRLRVVVEARERGQPAPPIEEE